MHAALDHGICQAVVVELIHAFPDAAWMNLRVLARVLATSDQRRHPDQTVLRIRRAAVKPPKMFNRPWRF